MSSFADGNEYVPAIFREVRQSGEEATSLFLEEGDSLAKAMALLQNGYSALHREQRRSLRQRQKYLDLLNGMKTVKQSEMSDLSREAKSCLHRLEQLLGIKREALTEQLEVERAKPQQDRFRLLLEVEPPHNL